MIGFPKALRGIADMRTAALFLTLAIALAALIACGRPGAPEPQPQDAPPSEASARGAPDSIPVSGSLVFPHSEALAFESPGIVGEVLISEGQSVTDGQLLASLNALKTAELRQFVQQAEARIATSEADLKTAKLPTAIARAEQEVAAAELAVDQARKALDDLTQSPNLTVRGAEQAVAQTAVALDNAREFLDDLLAPEDVAVAAANQRIAAARVEIDAAQEAYDDIKNGVFTDDILRDARNRVAFAETALAAANTTLADSQLAQENAVSAASDAYNLRVEQYAGLFKYWFGTTPTEDELLMTPQEMFAEWDIDLEATYDRRNPRYHGVAPTPDDPNTRWNEITVWAWLNLHPENGAVIPTCDDSFVLAARQRCVERDLENAYDALDIARDTLTAASNAADTTAERAADAVTAAQDALTDAQDDLKEVEDGPDASIVENAEKRLRLAQVSFADAQADLAELTVDIDPLLIAQARANLAYAATAYAEAQKTLDRALDDSLLQQNARERLDLANASLAQAQAQLEDSSALHQERIALAESELRLAQAALDQANEDLDGALLRAPFDGIVSLVNVDPDDRVSDSLTVIEITAADVVEVDGVIDAAAKPYVREGGSAVVNIESVGDTPLNGTVTFVDNEVRTERGVVSYAVRIRVDVPPGVRIPIRLSAVSAVIAPAGSARLDALPADAVASSVQR